MLKNRFLIILIFVTIQATLFAVPYHGKVMQFKQPDGSSVDVKLYGTEFYMRGESLDGYTLIRENTSKWICYATLSADKSELISTGIRYTSNQNSIRNIHGISQHLDISSKYREKVILKNRRLAGLENENTSISKTPPHPVNGYIKGLCIVVDFSDEPGTLPMSEFENFCNNLSYSNFGNNGSLRKYYSDISGGLVDYENVVYGYFRAPSTFAEYDQMPMAQGAQQILGLALNWIADLGFNFSTLTTNPDGSITAINLMYTGNPPTWSQGMWFHQGYYPNFTANGVHSGAYNCSPAKEPLEIAVVAHENGHMIGQWPDTYKYTSDNGTDGIGSFDLMCSYASATNPVPPNPHYISNAGWGRIVDITNFNGLNSDTANTLTAYKYVNPNDTNEFFLLQNRTQVGRSASIPDEGLTIWHIDRGGDNQTTHHEVYLEHAGNDLNDHANACFHFGFNTEFGNSTSPNSDYYNANLSSLRVWQIGNTGPVMTYKLGFGQPAPSFLLHYTQITNDNNANGFIEQGESADLNVQIKNFGQLSSSSATATCSVIGTNAQYITITNPSISLGVIAVNQMIPTVYHILIAANTPIGTVIDFKFLVSDGTFSNNITKSIMVGQQIIIGEVPSATCAAIFLDNGGNVANYSNMTDYTTTLVAPTANTFVKVNFVEFQVEDSQDCIYDYLKIYNGPTTSSPLIGMYCGTNNPGTIVSTDPSGALTFQFHADEGVTGTGWNATVSCESTINIEKRDLKPTFSISPNPFTENAIITVSNASNQASISIVDIFGKEIVRFDHINSNKININRTALSNGIYFMRLYSGDSLSDVKKIVVY